MKNLTRFLLSSALILIASQPVTATADAPTKPIITSFTMTPDTVDIATTNTTVNFDLVVTNPTGISQNPVKVTLTDGAANSLITTILRTDSPVQPTLSTVKFHGSIVIPSNFPVGIYSATVVPIGGINADGSAGYFSDGATAKTTSKLIGALDSLQVRSQGVLNLKFATFTGPTWNKRIGNVYVNPKFNTVENPILKVGETLNPNDYYELNVPTLKLNIKSNTSRTCTSDGFTLKFIAIGSCSYTVYTDGNNDYLGYKDEQSAEVTAARIKPDFFVQSIPTQSSANLPLNIAGPMVYSPMGIVLPSAATPLVCFPTGTYIQVLSGGTCILNYSTPATSDYLASDVHQLKFEITRTAQTVTFELQPKVDLASKVLPLAATASSGLSITYSTDTPDICLIDSGSLKLVKAGTCKVTATQVGSKTISPASMVKVIQVTGAAPAIKRIACVKNGKIKYFLSKKCPAGYKQKQ